MYPLGTPSYLYVIFVGEVRRVRHWYLLFIYSQKATRTVCVRSTCSFSWNLNLFFKITTTCEHSSRAYIRMLVITTKWNDIAQYASVLFTAEWICFRHPSNFMASLMFSTAQQFARNQACRYQIKDFLVAQLNAEWTVNKCSGDRIFVVFWKHWLSMKRLTVLF